MVTALAIGFLALAHGLAPLCQIHQITNQNPIRSPDLVYQITRSKDQVPGRSQDQTQQINRSADQQIQDAHGFIRSTRSPDHTPSGTEGGHRGTEGRHRGTEAQRHRGRHRGTEGGREGGTEGSSMLYENRAGSEKLVDKSCARAGYRQKLLALMAGGT